MPENNAIPHDNDRPIAVGFSDNMLRVTLQDGRIIATPLDWYPSLQNATPEQRENFELGFAGVHWPDIDEDLSVLGMLQGNRPPTPQASTAQAGTE